MDTFCGGDKNMWRDRNWGSFWERRAELMTFGLKFYEKEVDL